MDVTRNRDAELAMIGICLNDRPNAVRLAALPDGIFSALDTQAAHRAIRKLLSDGVTPDMITVDRAMQAEVENPVSMLADALCMGILRSQYEKYEALLYDCYKRRIAIDAATQLLRGANDPGENIDALMTQSIDAVRSMHGSATSVSMSEALEALFDEMNKGGKDRCQTGIANLDRLTGGIQKGNLVVIGARPGVGKTALALAMATHVALHTGPVLFVSMEMSETEIAARVCAAASKLDLEKISTGKLNDAEWGLFVPAAGELSKMPMRLDTRARTPSQIRREAVAMQNGKGLSMIVVDYMQLLHTDRRNESRYQEVSEVSRELKLMAMDLNVPIVVLTQFNRESEKTFGSTQERRKPKMSEAKDSGSIEQDANIFLTQWEPSAPTEEGTREWNDYHTCEFNGWTWQVLEVEKNRQGRTGRISMAFDKAHMAFYCLEQGAIMHEQHTQ